MASPVGPLAGAARAGAKARRTLLTRRARVRAPKVLSLKAERRRRALPMRSHRAARARQLRLDALRRAGRSAAYRKELRRRWAG
jgi:hypothetical protein